MYEKLLRSHFYDGGERPVCATNEMHAKRRWGGGGMVLKDHPPDLDGKLLV